MKVKNVIGSSRFEKPKGFDSWLDYWEQMKGKRAGLCSATDCFEKADVGAHVQKAYSLDKSWYIVPLSEGCNHRTDVYEVPDEDLVPVPSNL